MTKILLAIWLIAACGSYDDSDYPTPQPVDGRNPDALTVLQIMQENCATCHRPGGQFPAFTTQADIDRSRDRICVRVLDGTMPPPPLNLAEEKVTILLGELKCR